ncbi:MAG: hypothetical protein P4L53_22510 [Candidatus Obscuribacterales bacterium]|nr:hypothetical protein [Candidatus Obscuribacterales bacterium]
MINQVVMSRLAVRSLVIVATLFAVLMLTSAVRAAENTAPGARSIAGVQSKAKSGMPRPASADKDYANEKLTTFVDLPDVPKYSGAGAVFIDGLKYPNDNFGQDITMTFGVMEQAQQVNDWYKAALQQYQWTIYPVKPDPSARDSYSIDAGKGKYNINLIIKGMLKQPYRTRVVIRYKFGK